jgi:hypothetical protein
MKTIILAFALAAVGIYGIAKAAPQTCPGDANGDNVVNILDLSFTVSHLHQGTAPYQYGDVNGDMIVTQADLDIEAANYGRVCLPVGGLATD